MGNTSNRNNETGEPALTPLDEIGRVPVMGTYDSVSPVQRIVSNPPIYQSQKANIVKQRRSLDATYGVNFIQPMPQSRNYRNPLENT